jgi:CBS domain-containing protein
VVDGENKLKGITSLDGMKGIMISPETWDWILAADVMAEGKKTLKSDISLCEAMDYMRDNSVEEIPIVDEDRHVVGMLDSRSIHIRLTEEVVRLREE